MTEEWYGDGWDGQDWDDSGWGDNSWGDDRRKMQRSGGLGWIAIAAVLILALLALGYFLLPGLTDSPEKAAKAWLEALTSMDDQRALALTCANVTSSNRTDTEYGGMLLSFFQNRDGMLQDLGIPLDISGLAEYLEFDMQQLSFQTVYEEEDHAVVHVGDQLVIRFQVISAPLPLNENWQMSREDGRWKWCGR